MSERLEVSASPSLVLIKGCPKCGNQSFKVEYADMTHRLVCNKCGESAWLPEWPFPQTES